MFLKSMFRTCSQLFLTKLLTNTNELKVVIVDLLSSSIEACR